MNAPAEQSVPGECARCAPGHRAPPSPPRLPRNSSSAFPEGKVTVPSRAFQATVPGRNTAIPKSQCRKPTALGGGGVGGGLSGALAPCTRPRDPSRARETLWEGPLHRSRQERRAHAARMAWRGAPVSSIRPEFDQCSIDLTGGPMPPDRWAGPVRETGRAVGGLSSAVASGSESGCPTEHAVKEAEGS